MKETIYLKDPDTGKILKEKEVSTDNIAITLNNLNRSLYYDGRNEFWTTRNPKLEKRSSSKEVFPNNMVCRYIAGDRLSCFSNQGEVLPETNVDKFVLKRNGITKVEFDGIGSFIHEKMICRIEEDENYVIMKCEERDDK
ncbi:MAG: hypothetical protein ACOCQD_01840 [archaeon]